MTWDESKHPRDNEGKFTYKNGGGNTDSIQKSYTQAPFKLGAQTDIIKENPADILYRESKIKAEKDKQESEYKSKLLDILGDKATHADILYGTTKGLEKKIRELGLINKLDKENKLDDVKNKLKEKYHDIKSMFAPKLKFPSKK